MEHENELERVDKELELLKDQDKEREEEQIRRLFIIVEEQLATGAVRR